jgi:preprotein translocase subunit SecG
MHLIIAFLLLILVLLTQKQQHPCGVAFDLKINAPFSSVITCQSTFHSAHTFAISQSSLLSISINSRSSVLDFPLWIVMG